MTAIVEEALGMCFIIILWIGSICNLGINAGGTIPGIELMETRVRRAIQDSIYWRNRDLL